jgi:hypothetical protein
VAWNGFKIIPDLADLGESLGMVKSVSASDTGNKNSVPPSDGAAGVPQIPIQPAFVRLPRPGQREPFSGLCRSQLFQLIKTGRVKSHSLKMPGATRGVRLIDTASLVSAIQSFSDGHQAETKR